MQIDKYAASANAKPLTIIPGSARRGTSMVFVKDDGVFDAPIEKVWKYLNDTTGRHQHDAYEIKGVREQKGNTLVLDVNTKRPKGGWDKEVWKFIMDPPFGFEFEALEGPAKGTRQTHTYIPVGNKTKVIVTGDFRLAGMDDATTRKMTLKNLENAFDQDNGNIQKL